MKRKPLFDEDVINVSAIAWTQGAMQRLHCVDVLQALTRHFRGEWGYMSPADCLANDENLQYGGPVMSCHMDRHREKFLILTDQGHATTTVLLPDEY